ncbi:MAG: four helix bundle protein [Acidobacteria bacterium]|nr:four helix bundle protein [Acidobacteriota bacterium]
MQDFRNLAVWREAHQLVLSIYRETSSFPSVEQFGITQQMRRSAASIATNFAEGCGRGSDADFARFIQMGLGSASELEYQILLTTDLGYLPPAASRQLSDHVKTIKKMATALLIKLRRPQRYS